MAKSLKEIKGEYGKYIKKAAERYGFNANALGALVLHESRGDQYAIGGAGEWGLTQLMPQTAMSIADSLGFTEHGGDPEKLKQILLDRPGMNILFGAKYYSDQLNRAGGDYGLAYSMYNAGPAYGQNRPDVFQRLSAGDFDGTDEISTNARNFLGAMSLTGYDPATRAWPQRPQNGPGSSADQIGMGLAMSSYGQHRDALGAPEQAGGDLVGSVSSLQPDQRYQPRSVAELEAGDQDNPVVSGYRNFVRTGSLNYFDPLKGEDEGDGLASEIGGGLGSGAAVGLTFTPIGAATKPLMGVPYVGRLLAPAVGMGAYEAAMKPHGQPGGDGEGGGVLEQMKQRAGMAARGAGMGAVLGGLSVIPGFSRLAQGIATGPALDAAVLSGMEVGERAIHGQPLDVGGALRRNVPLAIGMRGGSAVGHAMMPRSINEIAAERAARAVRAGREAVAANDAQSRLLLPEPGKLSKIVPEPPKPRPEGVMADRVYGRVADEAPARRGQPSRGDVTAEATGLQSGYEFLARKIGEFRTSRNAAREAKIHEKTMEILSNPEIHASGRSGIASVVDGKVVFNPVEGEPITQVMAAFNNGRIGLRDVIETMRKHPEMTKTSPEVEAYLKDLNARVEAGEVTIAEARSQWRDRRRFFREATGGEAQNPAYRAAMRVGEMAEMFREKVKQQLDMQMIEAMGEVKGPQDAEAAGRFLNAWGNDLPADRFAQTEAGRKALSGAKNPQAVIDAAPAMARELELQRDIRNSVREIFAPIDKEGAKQFKEMGNIEGYFPHTEKDISFIRDPKGWWEQKTRPVPQGTTKAGNKVYSPFERRRTGKMQEDQIEWNAHEVLGKYNSDTARVLSNSIALNAGENLAASYRDLGLNKTARAISEVTQQSYGGKMSPAAQERMATRGGVVQTKAALAMKQAFNSATYALNIPFMALRQWTSVGLIPAHGEVTPADVAWALAKMNSPRIRSEFESSYTGWIKNRRRGGLQRQGDLRTDFLSDRLGKEGGLMDAMRYLSDSPVSFMENTTGRFAFAMGERIGRKAGLSGERLNEFKSDIAGLTQSYYDSLNRAPILNDPFTNLLFPAQGYSVEVANTYRSMMRGETGAGAKPGNSKRALRVFNTALTTYMLNLLYTYMMAYKGDERGFDKALLDPELHLDNAIGVATGGVPYIGAIIGSGPGGGRTMPSQRFAEFEKALGRMTEGDWESALAQIGRKQIRGGNTIYRITEAQRMYEEGRISEDDLIAAMIMGWYTTESGKDYLGEKVNRGPIREAILGEQSGSGSARRPTRPTRPQRPQRPGR